MKPPPGAVRQLHSHLDHCGPGGGGRGAGVVSDRGVRGSRVRVVRGRTWARRSRRMCTPRATGNRRDAAESSPSIGLVQAVATPTLNPLTRNSSATPPFAIPVPICVTSSRQWGLPESLVEATIARTTSRHSPGEGGESPARVVRPIASERSAAGGDHDATVMSPRRPYRRTAFGRINRGQGLAMPGNPAIIPSPIQDRAAVIREPRRVMSRRKFRLRLGGQTRRRVAAPDTERCHARCSSSRCCPALRAGKLPPPTALPTSRTQG